MSTIRPDLFTPPHKGNSQRAAQGLGSFYMSAEGLNQGELPPSGDWVIHGGINAYSNFSMEAIYPRPDAETNTFAYHRKKHSQVNYRVPVGVRGGSVPYRFELIQGPTGMTIGQEMDRNVDLETGKIVHAPGETYGIINWDDSEATGTHTVQVRVTDQLGATLDLTWTVECDDAAFVFCNSVTGSDANPGTFASPLQTFHTGLWKSSDTDTTYVGKIAMFTGTFDIYAAAANTSPALNMANKPVSYIGLGGCTFNTSQGHFRVTGQISDLTEMGIDFTGTRTDLDNNRLHNFTQRMQRHTVFDCTFDNVTKGNVGDDNAGCFFYTDSTDHRYIYLCKNELLSGVTTQFYCLFEARSILEERNSGIDLNFSGIENVLLPKDDCSQIEMRYSTFKANSGTILSFFQQNTAWPGATSGTDQEVRFNTYINTNTSDAILWNGQSGQGSNGRNGFLYRNTVISGGRAYQFRNADDPEQNFTVTLFDELYSEGASSSGINTTEVPSGESAPVELLSGDFDALGKLTGSAKTQYLGVAGAQLASAA